MSVDLWSSSRAIFIVLRQLPSNYVVERTSKVQVHCDGKSLVYSYLCRCWARSLWDLKAKREIVMPIFVELPSTAGVHPLHFAAEQHVTAVLPPRFHDVWVLLRMVSQSCLT